MKTFCGQRKIPDGPCSYVCGEPREGVQEEPLQCNSCMIDDLEAIKAQAMIVFGTWNNGHGLIQKTSEEIEKLGELLPPLLNLTLDDLRRRIT